MASCHRIAGQNSSVGTCIVMLMPETPLTAAGALAAGSQEATAVASRQPAAVGSREAAGGASPRPAYLLADSRLLFARPEAGAPASHSLVERLRADLPPGACRAAYLGASNGDEPAFYEIFTGAMELLGLAERRFVRTAPAAADLDFLRRADLVLLAGGDVLRGWTALAASGAAALVAERYRAGALLVGVSAGAVQLGHGWLPPEASELFPTAGLLPFLVDAHDEPEWVRLRSAVRRAPGYLPGLGIPFGGAAIVAPDMTVEPIGKPLLELFRREEGLQEALLLPAGPPSPREATPDAPLPAGAAR